MKKSKMFNTMMAGTLSLTMLLTACAGNGDAAKPNSAEESNPEVSSSAVESKAENAEVKFSDEYSIKDITLCGTNTNDSSFMKGFSMMGLGTNVAKSDKVFSVAMCYTTANLDEVKAFFTAEPFNDPAGFLAEIDALDLDGKIKNLTGDKIGYLDGAVDNPIHFYGDGVDLINGGSLLQNAGEYHFYLVTVGYDNVLWIGEADRTFVMEQSAIDLSNDFASAFEVVVETKLMTDAADVSGVSQEDRIKAVQEHFASAIDALNLGITVSVEYENDSDYPDDYKVILTKDGVESYRYVPVYFGAEK